MSYEQIAGVIDCPVNQRSRLHRSHVIATFIRCARTLNPNVEENLPAKASNVAVSAR